MTTRRFSRLTTNITTPDAAFGVGVGRYADPRFSVDFDVYITLNFAANTQKVTANSATIEVKASKPRGANFTGWLARAGADVMCSPSVFFNGVVYAADHVRWLKLQSRM